MIGDMTDRNAIGVVQKRRHRDQEQILIDFRSRRVTPRKLYTYLGVTIRTEVAAEAYLTLIRDQLARGRTLQDVLDEVGPQGGAGPAIEPMMEEWLALFRRQVNLGDRSGNTLRDYERWCTPGPYGYLTWWCGASLFTVDEATLEDWSLWMAEKGLSAKTRRNVMAAFHTFCVWARKRRKTWEIPEFPWPVPDDHIPQLISPELQQQILDAIPSEKRGAYLAMTQLLIRPNEARVARISDLRGDNVLIRRGQKDRRVGGREGGTKKRKGSKLLPIPEQLAEWLEENIPAERRLDGEAFLFQNPDATNERRQWSEAAMRRTWYSACKAVGVRISLYEGTKHSTATALKAAGVEDRVLAQIAGHSDVRSIQKYSKIQTAVIENALARLPRGGHVGASRREADANVPKTSISKGNRSSNVVEAAGIEPASAWRPAIASTCVGSVRSRRDPSRLRERSCPGRLVSRPRMRSASGRGPAL